MAVRRFAMSADEYTQPTITLVRSVGAPTPRVAPEVPWCYVTEARAPVSTPRADAAEFIDGYTDPNDKASVRVHRRLHPESRCRVESFIVRSDHGVQVTPKLNPGRRLWHDRAMTSSTRGQTGNGTPGSFAPSSNGGDSVAASARYTDSEPIALVNEDGDPDRASDFPQGWGIPTKYPGMGENHRDLEIPMSNDAWDDRASRLTTAEQRRSYLLTYSYAAALAEHTTRTTRGIPDVPEGFPPGVDFGGHDVAWDEEAAVDGTTVGAERAWLGMASMRPPGTVTVGYDGGDYQVTDIVRSRPVNKNPAIPTRYNGTNVDTGEVEEFHASDVVGYYD